LTYFSREAQKLGKLAGQFVRTLSGVIVFSNHIVLSMPEIKLVKFLNYFFVTNLQASCMPLRAQVTTLVFNHLVTHLKLNNHPIVNMESIRQQLGDILL
jgi:hypothetical protein